MSIITTGLKIGNEGRQIFKCSLHTKDLELKDELIIF